MYPSISMVSGVGLRSMGWLLMGVWVTSGPLHAQGVSSDWPSLTSALIYPAATFSAPADTLQRHPDPWLGYDKAQHAAFGFLLTLGGQYVYETKSALSQNRALLHSVSTTAAVGILKELYDWQFGPYHHFSLRDLVADALGILLAVTLIKL